MTKLKEIYGEDSANLNHEMVYIELFEVQRHTCCEEFVPQSDLFAAKFRQPQNPPHDDAFSILEIILSEFHHSKQLLEHFAIIQMLVHSEQCMFIFRSYHP